MGAKRLAPVVLALGLALFALAIGARTLTQYDLPWHLAFGRQIVADRAIPTVDAFSWAPSELHYLSPVSELVLYGLERLGGALALQAFGAALALAVAAILIVRARRHGVAGVGLAALGLFAMNPWLTVRPATTTFVFCAGLLGLIEVHRARPTSRAGRGALLAALAITPLWANSHGGAIVAVLVLGLYAAHRTLATALGRRWPNLFPPADGGALALPWIAAALAPLLVLLNPAGLAYFTGVGLVAPYAALISEWSPTSLDYFVSAVPAAGAFVVLAAGFLAFGREPSGSRVPRFDAIVLIGGAAALTTVMRFVPLAIVVLVPIVARRMGGLVRDRPRSRALFAGTVAVAAVSIASVDTTTHGVGWEPKNFPVAAVDFVERAGLHGRMWNFWPYGGYLLWRLYPTHLVALDGRFGLVAYEHDHVMRVVASEHDDAAFRELVADHDLQWAFCYGRDDVVRSCRPVAKDPAWTMVYWDDVAAIYVARSGPNRALAERGYRIFRHLMRPEEVLALVERGRHRAAIAHDGALARAQAPTSTRAAFLAAVGALAADDREGFLAALAALGELAPYHPALPALVALLPRLRGAR